MNTRKPKKSRQRRLVNVLIHFFRVNGFAWGTLSFEKLGLEISLRNAWEGFPLMISVPPFESPPSGSNRRYWEKSCNDEDSLMFICPGLLKLNPWPEPFGGDNPACMYGMEDECRMDGRFVADEMNSVILLKTIVCLKSRNTHLCSAISWTTFSDQKN